MRTGTLRLRAYAKINWSLEVTGRRDDGYHDLVTVLQTVAFDDLVEVTPADQEALVVRGAEADGVPTGGANLVTRAVERFNSHLRMQAQTSDRYRCELTLEKRIPPAAGLGGGSSDAAAALRALNRLSDDSFTIDEVESLAAGLGSDIAFFVRGGTQLVTGRGERVAPLPDAPSTWFVIVTPPTERDAKTARLYALLTADHFSDGTRTRAIAEELRLGRIPDRATLVNTFERVADAAFPGLHRYRERLRDRCGVAILCGSGPSLFAPMSGRSDAERAAADLRADGLRAEAVQTVTAADSIADEWIHHDGPVDILE